MKQELLGERIQCERCNRAFPITVLAYVAVDDNAAFHADNRMAHSTFDNFGNVLALTDAAAGEIGRRHSAGRFDADVVVRVTPDPSDYRKVLIHFDFALADGRDCILQSQGIPIVIARGISARIASMQN